MTNIPASQPSFEKPPVCEVVHGVTFKLLEGFSAIHVGLLWANFKSDFPAFQEHPPLVSAIEDPKQIEITISNTPPLPRTWFISEDERFVLQIQQDRFLQNWRRKADDDVYPSFEQLIELFESRYAGFNDFLAAAGLPAPEPSSFELTYVNQIPFDTATDTIGAVFPDFVWRGESRFLPAPKSFNYRASFALPDAQGSLQVHIRPGNYKGVRGLTLEIGARGGSAQKRDSWFAVAHDWVVRCFEDITSERVRKDKWRQK